MNAKGKLVAPRRDAMNDAVFRQELHHRIDGRKDRAVQEFRIIAVVILLALHRLTFGGELLRRDVAEGPDAGDPPLDERLVDHGRES